MRQHKWIADVNGGTCQTCGGDFWKTRGEPCKGGLFARWWEALGEFFSRMWRSTSDQSR